MEDTVIPVRKMQMSLMSLIVTRRTHALTAHDRRKRLLELISANASISIAELSLIMVVAKCTVERDISWLKEYGYISGEGNSKSGCWRVCKSMDD